MSDLRSFTLWARSLLTQEVMGLLQQVYRLDAQTGARQPVPKGHPLEASLEAQVNRQRIEKLLDDEVEAGLNREDAVTKLIKETAFTHLNRLVAFKLMEAMGLVRSPLARHHAANGFKMWLGDNSADEALYKQGDSPNERDGFGEAPRDRAYRHYLLWQCGELAKEIRVLFDPGNVPSLLFPRPGVLRELIDALNADDRKDDWMAGNEETVGWVYQFFNDEEKAEVFNRLYRLKQKIRREDIPAATQLFTPRWMVQYLVHNTLGRLWMELHTDSELGRSCLNYLVPFEPADSTPSTKRAMDIRVLDPACGTMHFGLVAFDVLFEMYVEELEKAGLPGWPAKASVMNIDEIPAKIIDRNLYGIDIDLRALQLSAVALYLKAKSRLPGVKITGINLACADVSSLADSHLEMFLRETHLEGPILQRSVRTLWTELKPAGDAGSLLRPEEAIKRVIEEERTLYDRERHGKLPLPELEDSFDQAAEAQDFWGGLESRLLSAFDEFAQYQRRRGSHEEYFVGELDKGFTLLRFLRRRYDVVLCNPPYSGRKNMNDALRRIMSSCYPRKGGDLFSAFIARCQELTKPAGKVGMVTIHSFMFVSSYEDLRSSSLSECRLETIVHLGARTEFEIANKTAQGFVLFTLAKKGNGDQEFTCFRLTKEGYGSEKRHAFEQALTNVRSGSPDMHVFACKPSDFAAIPGGPWVYWITPGLRSLFLRNKSLGETSPGIHGTATYDNFRFLRYWWEVEATRLSRDVRSWHEYQSLPADYVPYMKGGAFRRWYGNQEYVLQMVASGRALISFLDSKRDKIRGMEKIFHRGVTWTDLTAAKFSARLSPGGFIFDVSGSSVFPEDVELVLAVMNSTWAQYALKLINPTIHVQVGDLARLPLPNRSSDLLREFADRAIALSRVDSEEDGASYDFIAPAVWPDGIHLVTSRHQGLAELEMQIDEEVYCLYEISPEDRDAIEEELATPLETNEVGEDAAESNKEEVPETEESPSLTPTELAQSWVGYAVGIALGRFAPGKPNGLGRGNFTVGLSEKLQSLVAPEGLMVLQRDHPDELAARVLAILTAIHGEKETGQIICTAIGGNGDLRDELAGYLLGPFFKAHVKRYRKRPVYWLVQSPKQNYSAYLFHERATDQTLALLQGVRYLGGRIFQLKQQLEDANRRDAVAEGRERARWRKQAQELAEELADLETFNQLITATNSEAIVNAEGKTTAARWMPEFDDGVLLNAAPLYRLTPAWKRADAKLDLSKAWKALKDGEYPWAKTAMRYWPRETLAACKDNKSYRIAHGLE